MHNRNKRPVQAGQHVTVLDWRMNKLFEVQVENVYFDEDCHTWVIEWETLAGNDPGYAYLDGKATWVAGDL